MIIEWIDFFNATLNAPAGNTVSLSVGYFDSSEFPSADVVHSSANGVILGGSAPVLLPVPPETEVLVTVARDLTSISETYRVTVTGRLEDVAQ